MGGYVDVLLGEIAEDSEYSAWSHFHYSRGHDAVANLFSDLAERFVDVCHRNSPSGAAALLVVGQCQKPFTLGVVNFSGVHQNDGREICRSAETRYRNKQESYPQHL